MLMIVQGRSIQSSSGSCRTGMGLSIKLEVRASQLRFEAMSPNGRQYVSFEGDSLYMLSS